MGVQEAPDGGGDGLPAPVRAAIPALYGVYGALRRARERRGALDLELPERVVTLGDDGAVAHVGFARRFDSHRLIEELMIAANVAAASALEAKNAPCMYRVHDRPDTAKLETLREFMRSRGIALPRGGAVRPDTFNRFLALLEDPQRRRGRQPDDPARPGAGRIQPPQHRPLRPRAYALRPLHLADPPLCRPAGAPRADRGLQPRGWRGAAGAEAAALEQVGAHISSTERRAQAAERDALDRYCAAYLAEHTGAEFGGRIAGVTRFGVFVSLDETGAEGLVPARTLGASRPRFDARRQTLDVDRRTLSLGDPVVVSLEEADPMAGGLTFSLVTVNGEAWAPTERGGGRRGRPRRRR